MRLTSAFLAALLTVAGCSESGDTEPMCDGAKCDLPDDPGTISCERGRTQALNDNQRALTRDALRWSCADVSGVTGDDRGQEYCEYFAIVSVPGEEDARIVGKNLGIDSWDGTTPNRVALTNEQIYTLEQDESSVVGQCIFTSWNSDIDTEPSCEGGCGDVLGVTVDSDTFRMTFEANSAEAAQLLVEDCAVIPPGGDAGNPDDPLHDPYYRGCMLNDELNDTAFRKSDSTACVAAVRLAECGCSLSNGGDLSVELSPYDRRGFPLGSWAGTGDLPPSCHYVELGDGSQTVVSCDLTAADLLNYSMDPKGRCSEKYADNVVVHVPIPANDIVCSPSDATPYSDTCTQDPWVL